MKLIDVTVEDGYLVIHTDIGQRRKKLGEHGQESLRAKAASLKGKYISTTTWSGWDPLRWFATIEEVRPPVPSSRVSANQAQDVILSKTNSNFPPLGRTSARETLAIPTEAIATSFAELISRAEAGDSGAQFALAKRYDQGEGTSRNLMKATHWYQRAADQGNEAAAHLLGNDISDESRVLRTWKPRLGW